MRQVIVDTETTGLDVSQGHRVIEIGCVELKNRRKTERHFHQYINPERTIDDGAMEVHGISNEDLAGKPVFADIAASFIDFIRDSELIIHNAPFDVEFLNEELKLLGPEWGRLEDYCARITDTLLMAREKHPGQKNNLDALCARYEVDNSQRDLHGALLDAQILLDVYLAMTGGQVTLSLDQVQEHEGVAPPEGGREIRRQGTLRRILPTAEELEAHRQRLAVIQKESDGNCLWLQMESDE